MIVKISALNEYCKVKLLGYDEGKMRGKTMRNVCYVGSVVVLILTFLIHQDVLSLNRGLIPLGFLLSIVLLIIGGIVAARASHNIDFLFKKGGDNE